MRRVRLKKKDIKEIHWCLNNDIVITLNDGTEYVLHMKSYNLAGRKWDELKDWLYNMPSDPYSRRFYYKYKKQRGFVIDVLDPYDYE